MLKNQRFPEGVLAAWMMQDDQSPGHDIDSPKWTEKKHTFCQHIQSTAWTQSSITLIRPSVQPGIMDRSWTIFFEPKYSCHMIWDVPDQSAVSTNRFSSRIPWRAGRKHRKSIRSYKNKKRQTVAQGCAFNTTNHHTAFTVASRAGQSNLTIRLQNEAVDSVAFQHLYSSHLEFKYLKTIQATFQIIIPRMGTARGRRFL